jgi:hypothetical protein
VVTKAYQREETYKDRGELEIGPDIIVGTARGRGSRATRLWARWERKSSPTISTSGAATTMDHETVPGILLTNRPLKKPAPGSRTWRSRCFWSSESTNRFNLEKRKTEYVRWWKNQARQDLLARVKKYSDIAGYSFVEEFITHALEKELAKLEDAGSEEEIKKRV